VLCAWRKLQQTCWEYSEDNNKTVRSLKAFIATLKNGSYARCRGMIDRGRYAARRTLDGVLFRRWLQAARRWRASS